MSETERIHEASPLRLIRAREDGVVARSAELSRSVTICVITGAVLMFSGAFAELFSEFLLKRIAGIRLSTGSIDSQALYLDLSRLLSPIAIFLAGTSLLAITIWNIQSPLRLNVGKAVPDISRLSPQSWFGRVFSLTSLVQVLLGLLLLFGLAMVLGGFVWYQGRDLAMPQSDLSTSLAVAGGFLRNVLLTSGGLIIAFGVLDYFREKFRIASQLKMTEQERRDEARESEMNPHWRRTWQERQQTTGNPTQR